MKKHVELGNQIPKTFEELASLEHVIGRQRINLGPNLNSERKHYDFKYFPDAWGKPGKVLLQSLVLGTYVVTFGDGYHAILTYYYRTPREYELNSRGSVGILLILKLLIFLLVTFFITIITGRIIKRRLKKSTGGIKSNLAYDPAGNFPCNLVP